MKPTRFSFILILVTAFALAQCSGGDKDDANSNVKENTTATTQKTPPSDNVAIQELNNTLKKVTVYFPNDSATPSKELFPKSTLEKVAGLIRAAGINGTGEYVVVATGHATKVGSEQYNEGLAQRRAEYIVKWFTNGGIPRKAFRATNDGTRQNKRAVTFEVQKR